MSVKSGLDSFILMQRGKVAPADKARRAVPTGAEFTLCFLRLNIIFSLLRGH